MAVLKIDIVSIVGRMSDLDQVTSFCGRSCVFHPDNALSFYSDTSEFTPINEQNPYSEPLQQLTEALTGAGKKLKLLSSDDISKIKMSKQELMDYVTKISSAFNKLHRQRDSAQKAIADANRQIDQISHFVGLDLNLDEIHACEYIKFRFGSLPIESYEKLKSYQQNPYVVFFPSTVTATHYWGVYFSPIDMVSEVDRIFSSLYFERTRLTEFKGTPEAALETLKEKLQTEQGKIREIDSRFDALWKTDHEMCQKAYTWLTEQSIYYGIRHYAATYDGNFILTGWIPKEKENYFKKELDKIESIEYDFEGAEEELTHSPPIQLKNKKPFRPFEFFVNMYGLPNYNEVDPTILVAITYTLLFGVMFADLGQGLLVSLVGWYMWKKRKMALGKALIPCGISSSIVGAAFGSVFGFEHALDPLFTKVFGLPGKPIDVMEATTTNTIVYTAVGVGIFLVIVAMITNIYSSVKRRNYENALFGPNGAAGLIFYSSIVFGLGGQAVFGWQIVSPAFIVCFIILPVIAMFFREVLGGLVEGRENWKPESWGEFVMQNFFEVFEFLLSYVTNTMSFLRVGAFVLVHAGMMMVVFTLAGMSSGIGYVLIIVIGNLFVAALEGLLVGIQVLRLEFYEMFSRFFEGGGRPFKPVVVRAEQ
ncbi:MAG: ATPase [Clostridiales bacterium]|nr:ATPase [Clostridiales bacterium]